MQSIFAQKVAGTLTVMVALFLVSSGDVWAANWIEATGGPLKVCVDLNSIKKQSNGFTYYHEVFCQEKTSDNGYYNAVKCATAKSARITIIGRSPTPDAKGKYAWTDNSTGAATAEGAVARFVCSR